MKRQQLVVNNGSETNSHNHHHQRQNNNNKQNPQINLDKADKKQDLHHQKKEENRINR